MSRKLTLEEVVSRAKKVHGDDYDYNESEYKSYHEKMKIKCNQCGRIFEQRVSDHLRGEGCSCHKSDKHRLTLEQYIEKANIIHDYKYDYSELKKYLRGKDKIPVICHEKNWDGTEHGVFMVRAESHTYGKTGCPKCAARQRANYEKVPYDRFVFVSNEVHNNKYIYDDETKANFYDTIHKVPIICPNHGIFWQTPKAHMRGQGCPLCNMSHLERDIEKFLQENSIKYIAQMKDFDWLKLGRGLQSLDFYLPDYNIAIECQGEQHFKPVDFTGKGEEWANKQFEKVKFLDERKRKICNENNIDILYFAREKYNDNIITDKELLLEKIQEYGKL